MLCQAELKGADWDGSRYMGSPHPVPAAGHLFPGHQGTCPYLIRASEAPLVWEENWPHKSGIKKSRVATGYQDHGGEQ